MVAADNMLCRAFLIRLASAPSILCVIPPDREADALVAIAGKIERRHDRVCDIRELLAGAVRTEFDSEAGRRRLFGISHDGIWFMPDGGTSRPHPRFADTTGPNAAPGEIVGRDALRLAPDYPRSPWHIEYGDGTRGLAIMPAAMSAADLLAYLARGNSNGNFAVQRVNVGFYPVAADLRFPAMKAVLAPPVMLRSAPQELAAAPGVISTDAS